MRPVSLRREGVTTAVRNMGSVLSNPSSLSGENGNPDLCEFFKSFKLVQAKHTTSVIWIQSWGATSLKLLGRSS